jgi:hypothetical protein
MKNKQSVSQQLKKAGIKGGIAIRRGEWAGESRPKHVPGADKVRPKGKAPLTLPKETLVMMAKDKSSGMSDKEISKKYAVSTSYIQASLKTLFLTTKVGKEILKGVLLDNAVACGMRVRETVDELQPMQAAIATGIMTQRLIDLDKHTSNQPPDMDLNELAEVGKFLREIRTEVMPLTDADAPIIDISGNHPED